MRFQMILRMVSDSAAASGEPQLCVGLTAGAPLGSEQRGPSRTFGEPLFITHNTPHSPCQGHFFVLLQHTRLRITPRALLAAAGTVPSAGRSRHVPQQPPVEKAQTNTMHVNNGFSGKRRDLPLHRAAGGNGGAGVRPAAPRRQLPVPAGSPAQPRRPRGKEQARRKEPGGSTHTKDGFYWGSRRMRAVVLTNTQKQLSCAKIIL